MNIVFLCTHNRCRSVLHEAIFNHQAPEGFRAYSAGSQPSGVIHPHTLDALKRFGVSVEGLHSKSLDALKEIPMDVVVTVCDNAAAEPCPMYLGNAVRVHWNLFDPSKRIAADEPLDSPAAQAAFDGAVAEIQRRRDQFFAYLSLDGITQTFKETLENIATE